MRAATGPRDPLVRDMRLEDLPAVRAIEDAAYGAASPRTEFERELSNGFTHYLVALNERAEDGSIEGFAGMWLMVGQAHLATIAVAPASQRGGVATALLRRCAEVARAAELDSIALEVRVSNEGAHRFYERLGFTRAGTLRRYYRDPDEDATVMLSPPLESLIEGAAPSGTDEEPRASGPGEETANA